MDTESVTPDSIESLLSSGTITFEYAAEPDFIRQHARSLLGNKPDQDEVVPMDEQANPFKKRPPSQSVETLKKEQFSDDDDL